jgi:hypothetical protein
VAEMFGREDQTQAKHEKNREVTRKISYVGVAVISINYLIFFANKGIYRRITGEFSLTLLNWTFNIIPGFFLLGFCILLLVAILWVCYSLRHDKKLIGNDKWMAVHLVLLTLVLGSSVYEKFINQDYTA